MPSWFEGLKAGDVVRVEIPWFAGQQGASLMVVIRERHENGWLAQAADGEDMLVLPNGKVMEWSEPNRTWMPFGTTFLSDDDPGDLTLPEHWGAMKEGMPYHVSPRQNREQIEAEGLKTTDMRPDGTPQDPDGIYYWDTPEQAKYFGDEFLNEEPYDVWHFDLKPDERPEDDAWFDAMDIGPRDPYDPSRVGPFFNEDESLGGHVLPGVHQIDPERLRRMTHMPFERFAAFVLQAQWADVMSKAKRLVQENKVTVLNNTPESIIAHVIGDTGEHDVEIAREDPNSGVLTQTVCDCPWNQYRWDRTRPYKALEGRPCSHILAAYWKAKSTPIDSEAVPFDYQAPVGQRGPGVAPGQQALPIPEQPGAEQEAPAPELPSTQQIVTPPAPTNPFQAPQGAPGASGPMSVKVPQREQMRLFDVAPQPGGVPPAGPAPSFSMPGGTPPSPANVQIPGTFSKVAALPGHEIPMNTDAGVVQLTLARRQPNERIWLAHDGDGISYYIHSSGNVYSGQSSDPSLRDWSQDASQVILVGTVDPALVAMPMGEGNFDFDNWAVVSSIQWDRTAMAERSGDPELDTLITKFRAAPNTGNSEFEWLNPEHAWGQCIDQSFDFAGYLKSQGIQAEIRYIVDDPVTHDVSGFTDTHTDVIGAPQWEGQDQVHEVNIDDWFNDPDNETYRPELGGTRNRDFNSHAVVWVSLNGKQYIVDWTAAQFGYYEAPMVHRMDNEGNWQRTWEDAPLGQAAQDFRADWQTEPRSASIRNAVTTGWYHGTVYKRFAPGDYIVPGAESGTWANWTVFEDMTKRPLEAGDTVHPQDVVWITNDPSDAANWAEHSILKSTQAEIRLKSPAGGIAVYEVEPEGLDYPTDRHSEGEAICRRARVIREVSFEPFDMKSCDMCGEPATVGMGSENQLCASCAQEEGATVPDGWGRE